MAVSYIGVDTDSNGSATTTQSAGSTLTILEDDLLVAILHINGNGATVSDWDGFTEAGGGNGGDSFGHSFWVGYLSAGASESGDYTFTFTSGRASLHLLQFRGAAAMTEDVSPEAGSFEVSSTTTECNDITVADDSVAIAVHLEDNSVPQGSTFIGVSDSYNHVGILADQVQRVAYKLFTTGAATTEVVFEHDLPHRHVGWHMSFKEDGGGGGTILPMSHYNYGFIN